MKQILIGQIFLIFCCIFYIPWWFLVFRPGSSRNWTSGRAGILLLLTGICGIAGLILTITGMNSVHAERSLYSGTLVCILGILSYFGLMLFTVVVFQRPVTTELLLITGWTVLELTAVNAVYGTQVLETGKTIFLIVLILAAFVVNIILYILYDRMEKWAAYHWAAAPLGIDGIVMAIFVFLMLL